MVLLAAAAMLVLSSQDQASTKVFSDSDLGLSFQYPEEWALTQERYATVFTIPLANEQTATVQIFRSQFRQPAEDWQKIQSDVAGSMGRVVDRQWEETILGVPVLMTRVLYQEGGERYGVVVGLFYTATPFKFNYRMTAPYESLEEAEQAWRSALMTLRTTTGDLPQREDPNRPLPTRQEQTETREQRPTSVAVLRPKDLTGNQLRTENVATVEFEDSEFNLYLPEDFRMVRRQDENWIEHSSLSGPVKLTIGFGFEDQTRSALARAAGASLSRFTAVSLREDVPASTNRAGATVFRTKRQGTSGDQPLWMIQVAGNCDALYWLIEASGSEPMSRQQVEALESLIAVLFVEARS